MTVDFHQANAIQLIAQAEVTTRNVEERFKNLTSLQLNWKPATTEWSVGQCLDHLSIATNAYFPIIEQLLHGTKTPTFWERMPLLPSLFGPLLI